MNRIACASLAALLLSGCATTREINFCKGAEIRRSTYTAAIYAVDVLSATGRPVPREAVLARDAAALALAILDRNCPARPAVPPG